MKVYAYICEHDGGEYVSLEDSLCCPECGLECKKVEEGSTNSYSGNVSLYIIEAVTSKVVYIDGKKVLKKVRKKKIATEAQKKAAENARKFAHTPQAGAKRRKSMAARKDDHMLGQVNKL